MVHNVVSVSYFEVPVSSLFLNGKLLTRTSLERDKRAVESGQHMSRCGELEDHGLNQKVRWAVWVSPVAMLNGHRVAEVSLCTCPNYNFFLISQLILLIQLMLYLYMHCHKVAALRTEQKLYFVSRC